MQVGGSSAELDPGGGRGALTLDDHHVYDDTTDIGRPGRDGVGSGGDSRSEPKPVAFYASGDGKVEVG